MSVLTVFVLFLSSYWCLFMSSLSILPRPGFLLFWSSIFSYCVTMYTCHVFPVVCCQCSQPIDAVSYHAATLSLFCQTGVPRTVWRNSERVAEHTYLPLFSMQLLLLSPSSLRCPVAHWPFHQHTDPPPVHLATLFQHSWDSHGSHVFWKCYPVLTVSIIVPLALPFMQHHWSSQCSNYYTGSCWETFHWSTSWVKQNTTNGNSYHRLFWRLVFPSSLLMVRVRARHYY